MYSVKIGQPKKKQFASQDFYIKQAQKEGSANYNCKHEPGSIYTCNLFSLYTWLM